MSSKRRNEQALVCLERIDFSYPSDPEADPWRLLAEEICLRPGTFYSVLGPNMIGKSTLLRIVGGALEQDLFAKTQISLSGSLLSGRAEESSSLSARPIPNTALVLHDDPMFPELSIWDNVRLAKPASATQANRDVRSRVSDYLASVALFQRTGTTTDTLLGELSSGGRAMVRLARASVWDSKLLLVDEVTAHLDAANARRFLRGLVPFLRADGAVLLVSHQERDHQVAEELVQEAGLNYRVLSLARKGSVTCVEEA